MKPRSRWAPAGSIDVQRMRADLRRHDHLLDGLPPVTGASLPVEPAPARVEARVPARVEASAPKRPAVRATPLERVVLAGILRALKAAGYTTHRMTSGVFQQDGRTVSAGEPGMPDLLVELPGARVFWLEVKRLGGRVQPNQAQWHERARARGQLVGVAHSAAEALALVQEAAREA